MRSKVNEFDGKKYIEAKISILMGSYTITKLALAHPSFDPAMPDHLTVDDFLMKNKREVYQLAKDTFMARGGLWDAHPFVVGRFSTADLRRAYDFVVKLFPEVDSDLTNGESYDIIVS